MESKLEGLDEVTERQKDATKQEFEQILKTGYDGLNVVFKTLDDSVKDIKKKQANILVACDELDRKIANFDFTVLPLEYFDNLQPVFK